MTLRTELRPTGMPSWFGVFSRDLSGWERVSACKQGGGHMFALNERT